MDFGLANLIDKFEEYFGKKITYVLLTAIGLAFLLFAIDIVFDKAFEIYVLFEKAGLSLNLSSAAEFLEIVRTVVLVVVSAFWAFTIVERVRPRRYLKELVDRISPAIVKQDAQIKELKKMLEDLKTS